MGKTKITWQAAGMYAARIRIENPTPEIRTICECTGRPIGIPTEWENIITYRYSGDIIPVINELKKKGYDPQLDE